MKIKITTILLLPLVCVCVCVWHQPLLWWVQKRKNKSLFYQCHVCRLEVSVDKKMREQIAVWSFQWIHTIRFIFVSLYTILKMRCTFNIYIVNFLQIIRRKNQENKNISSTWTRGECWQKVEGTDCWLIFSDELICSNLFLFRCIQS